MYKRRGLDTVERPRPRLSREREREREELGNKTGAEGARRFSDGDLLDKSRQWNSCCTLVGLVCQRREAVVEGYVAQLLKKVVHFRKVGIIEKSDQLRDSPLSTQRSCHEKLFQK